MSNKDERVAVFRDTEKWIKENQYLSDAVLNTKKNTKVYYPDDYPDFRRFAAEEKIEVSHSRTFEAAMRLRRTAPEAKIAVLNFANAFQPGGGVTTGASAQEESLCRCSTLYPSLNRNSLKKSFYDYHKKLNSPKASDTIIYTKDIVICKTDTDYPERMKKEDWVTVDVITMAAPDLRKTSNVHVKLTGNGASMNDAELFGFHVKRAIHMLTVAAAEEADILVLGAFGCGAFQNDPVVVARAWKLALTEFPKVFKKIEFAVYTTKGGTNYDVFKRVLADM